VKLRKIVSALLLAFAVTMSASPAFAATGSFPWNVSMTHQVDSRNWTQTSGSTTIKSYLGCWGNSQVTTYRIELFKNRTFADTSYGAVTYTCSLTQQHTWTNLPSGTFHFTISKATDGKTATGSGTVTYPSN